MFGSRQNPLRTMWTALLCLVGLVAPLQVIAAGCECATTRHCARDRGCCQVAAGSHHCGHCCVAKTAANKTTIGVNNARLAIDAGQSWCKCDRAATPIQQTADDDEHPLPTVTLEVYRDAIPTEMPQWTAVVRALADGIVISHNRRQAWLAVWRK